MTQASTLWKKKPPIRLFEGLQLSRKRFSLPMMWAYQQQHHVSRPLCGMWLLTSQETSSAAMVELAFTEDLTSGKETIRCNIHMNNVMEYHTYKLVIKITEGKHKADRQNGSKLRIHNQFDKLQTLTTQPNKENPLLYLWETKARWTHRAN